MSGRGVPLALVALATLSLAGAAVMVGCGGGGGGGNSTLTLNLDSSLDGSDGTVLAATLTKAELLSPAGAVVQAGTISGNSAQFSLATVANGNYFIRVNDLADSLVPTRIDDHTATITQSVGKKLIDSFIGPTNDPTYHIKSLLKAQGEHAVVKYSDGTQAPPERYPYAMVSYKTSPLRLDIRVQGTAALLSSFTPGSTNHPGAGGAAFTTWMLTEQNHGVSYNGDDTKCSGCHGSLDTHAASFASIDVGNGWCYRCHYGKGGDGNGMNDPAQ